MSSSRRVDFFQLVSVLQRRAGRAAEIGHLGRRGTDLEPEALRIRPALSLAFPARDVERLEVLEQTSPQVRIEVNFGGLYGPDSPLPNAFTEDLLVDEYVSGGDDLEAVRDFLDIFHHRLYSLLFRAWERHRYVATFRRDGSDDISRFLFAVAGLGTEGLAPAAGGSLPALGALRLAGLARQRPRSAGVLRAALRDHLQVPVRIESFVTRVAPIAPRDRTYLGGARVSGERVPPRSLGRDTMLGARVVDVASKIRVVIGPLSRPAYEALLPGTIGRHGLDALTGRFMPLHVDVEFELVLESTERTEIRLGDGGAKLGWTSWLSAASSPAARFSSRFAGAALASA